MPRTQSSFIQPDARPRQQSKRAQQAEAEQRVRRVFNNEAVALHKDFVPTLRKEARGPKDFNLLWLTARRLIARGEFHVDR